MIYKKSDFYKDLNSNNLLLEDDTVEIFEKKTGALCEVNNIDGVPVLKNHNSQFVNNELAAYLIDCGIEGEIIIHHPGLNRNVPRWLSYKFTNEKLEDWADSITVFTFGKEPTKVGWISIEAIQPRIINVTDIHEVVCNLGKRDITFDGIYLNANTTFGPRRYYMVPLRYCHGKVVSCNQDADNPIIIAKVNIHRNEHLIRIDSTTNTMQQYIRDGDITGKDIRIQYTSYMPGDRLKNLASPAAIWVNNYNGA